MKLLSFEEAGGILSTPPDTVRLWYRQGLIPHYRMGRRVLFALEDLHAFLNARRVDATSGEAAQAANPQMLRSAGGKGHG